MTIRARRASALGLALVALVAISFALHMPGEQTPRALPTDTAAPSSAPPHGTDTDSADSSAAASSPGDAPVFVPPTTDFSSYDRDLDLAGVVVDPRGAPVAGATVQAVFHPARTFAPREASALVVLGPEVRSGVDGAFGVRLLRAQSAGLRVSAPGFVPCERSPAAAGSRLVVVLRPSVSCVVTLRDASRRPVAGRPVLLEHRPWPPDVLLHREAISDAEGRARFEDLPGGLTVTLSAGSVRSGREGPARFALPFRGTLEIDVTVPRGRTLHGRITDGATGRPIAGARVRLTIPRGGGTVTATADSDGRYALEGVPEPAMRRNDDDPSPPAPRVEVTAAGYVDASAAAPTGSVHDVSLESAETVTGRSVDGDGRPIAHAWVFLEVERRSFGGFVGRPADWEATPTAMTDADGRFRIATRTRYGGLLVEAVGFAPHDRRALEKDWGRGSLDVGDLVLGPGVMLQGHVTDGEGRPMPGVRVSVDDVTCTSDDLGRYGVRDLAPGRHRVRAVVRGRDQLERAVTLSLDRDPRVLDLAFPAGREVTIEVRDASGAPVAGASLDIVQRRIWESTDAQGRGAVVLPPGPWTARVAAGLHRHEDGRQALVKREAAIPADATHLVVTLDRTLPPEELVRVAGTAVDEQGQPADGVSLAVTWEGRGDASQRVERVRTGEDGGFAVRVPKGAVCDIRADARTPKAKPGSRGPASEPWRGEVRGVRAGRTNVVVVVRPEPRDRSVAVLVLSPDGGPVEGASVRLHDPLQRDPAARTDRDGRVQLSSLVGRSCSASVDPPQRHKAEWMSGHSPSFVPDGQEIVVRLARAAEITGFVLLADGSPARDANVWCTAGARRAGGSSSVDASGRFRLRVDADLALPWRLTAQLGADWPPSELSVDLAAPPSGDVTLRFPDPIPR